MKIYATYSHLNGRESLLIHEKHIWEEIEKTIQSIDANRHKTKVSKEKTMQGKLLYAPKEIIRAFAEKFKRADWKSDRTGDWIVENYDLIRRTFALPKQVQRRLIEAAGKKAIFSYNQTAFVKRRVAVEVQFGKYSFIPCDLYAKHLAFYVGDVIDVGVEILPMKTMQEQMSSGVGYYEGALYDVVRQGRGVPAVPLVLIGVEP